MSFIVLPDNVGLFHWGNSLRRSLSGLVVPIPPHTETNWWAWANLLISVNKLGYITIADKRMFPAEKDWRKWAWLFIKNYNLVQG